MQFKLLAGLYQDADNKLYKQGDVITTDIDLAEKFGPNKFQPLSGSRRAKATTPSDGGGPPPTRQFVHDAKGNPPTDQGATLGAIDGSQEIMEGQPNAQKQPVDGNGADGWDESDDGLDKMNLKQLNDLADNEGVQLHGATKKADVIEAIRDARQGS